MLSILPYGAAVLVAYLIGSIPTGYLVVKAIAGIDIREVGSGRTGGTNALRAGGKVAGVLTGLGDFLKGVGAVYLAQQIIPGKPLAEALCAVVVIAGHNWSVFNHFRGGAGTGPNVGAASALWPIAGVFLLPAVPIFLIVTGFASITSTLVAVSVIIIFALRAAFASEPIIYIGYAVAAAVLIAVALLPNYRRLIEGKERMVGPRARAQTRQSE